MNQTDEGPTKNTRFTPQSARAIPELVITVPNWATLREIDLEMIDACYLGQPFCLKYQGNFLTSHYSLHRATRHLKAHGKRVYLTTPAVPRQEELELVKSLFEDERGLQIDGAEVHEAGAFRTLRRNYPSLPLHVGHFANVYRPETAKIYAAYGAERVSPSYELTLDEKRSFLDIKGLDIELPIHGKLPLGMAYACVFTDGALGQVSCTSQCAARTLFEMQDWRMRCAGTTMLMAEDLTLIEYLPRVIAEGYPVFRLETTFDSAAKINQVAAIYRKAIDALLAAEKREKKVGIAEERGQDRLRQDLKKLGDLADDGICNGWPLGHAGRAYTGASALVDHLALDGSSGSDRSSEGSIADNGKS